jgi:hypothetical protein
MEKTEKDYSHIKGWGVDADPKNDPTYPIKNRTNEEHKGYSWNRPPQQPINMEVLHSNERPNVTAVFGATLPPKGLSGMIRRYAFKHGESSYVHWLPLILADRINVVEGVLDDIMHGKLPNIIEEKGLKADWKHDRAGLLQSVAVGVAGVAVVAFLLRRK